MCYCVCRVTNDRHLAYVDVLERPRCEERVLNIQITVKSRTLATKLLRYVYDYFNRGCIFHTASIL